MWPFRKKDSPSQTSVQKPEIEASGSSAPEATALADPLSVAETDLIRAVHHRIIPLIQQLKKVGDPSKIDANGLSAFDHAVQLALKSNKGTFSGSRWSRERERAYWHCADELAGFESIEKVQLALDSAPLTAMEQARAMIGARKEQHELKIVLGLDANKPVSSPQRRRRAL